MSTNFSTTTASRAILRAGAQICGWLVVLLLLNEVVFYLFLNVYPGRGDYPLELLKAAGQRKRFFLGSSRTMNAVNTVAFDASLHTPGASFNLAFNACTLADQYLMLENILGTGRHPEEIIVELSTPSFESDVTPPLVTRAIAPALGLSLPFAQRYSYIKGIIASRFHLPLRHFRGDELLKPRVAMQGHDPIFTKSIEFTMPEMRHRSWDTATLTGNNRTLSESTQQVLARIMRRCEEAGIKLRVLLPVQMTDQERSVLLPAWRRLPPSIRWSTDQDSLWTTLRAPGYWYNRLHTNSEGAEIYTRILEDTYR